MAKMTPCNVRHEGTWYHCAGDGTVNIGKGLCKEMEVIPEVAKAVKATVARLRRNKAARMRNATMRDLGMVRTPYGWE